MRPARIRTIAFIAVLLFMPCSIRAQEPSPSPEKDWTAATRAFWHIDGGYPIRGSVGTTFGSGQSRRLSGYEERLRGFVVGVDVGFVNADARFGWAWLRPYDAGMDGWSTEILVVRALGFDSRLNRGTTYVGPTVSCYLMGFRFSGGFLVGSTAEERSVMPIATAAVVIPFSR